MFGATNSPNNPNTINSPRHRCAEYMWYAASSGKVIQTNIAWSKLGRCAAGSPDPSPAVGITTSRLYEKIDDRKQPAG